ncbi:hypothetical protein F511_13412 [Dorcoceras hygrometricum]|uniref:Uncharacterized protein n=1 Tax=Dorcoceras hygrometricum TaxID=472368 RepID=A0A2Z7DDF3_9LAMI|nr:hypothetical protein F511_13412 [Dorcoceras hygrometricum]
MLTEAHGWELRSTNTNTINTTYWKLKPWLGTRSHRKRTKFYLNYEMHELNSNFVLLLQPTIASKSGMEWKSFKRGVQRYLEGANDGRNRWEFAEETDGEQY